MYRLGILLPILLATVSMGPVLADQKSEPDPVGDQGPMSFDIVSASHSHTLRTKIYPHFLAHTVTAADPVSNATIQDENLEFRFNFDTRSGPHFDRSVIVRYTSNGFQADMWADGYPSQPNPSIASQPWLGFVRVMRPDDRSLEIVFPRALLGRLSKDPPNSYRWMAEVYALPYQASFCGPGDQPPCYDGTAPIQHNLA